MIIFKETKINFNEKNKKNYNFDKKNFFYKGSHIYIEFKEKEEISSNIFF